MQSLLHMHPPRSEPSWVATSSRFSKIASSMSNVWLHRRRECKRLVEEVAAAAPAQSQLAGVLVNNTTQSFLDAECVRRADLVCLPGANDLVAAPGALSKNRTAEGKMHARTSSAILRLHALSVLP